MPESRSSHRWFVATGGARHFIVLNITLYASDYFTGDGINDAVLYTLTNSLTGAGVGKYILPGLGLVVARWASSPRWLGFCAVAVTVRIIMATACWRCAALASVDASPAFHQITELVKSQSRDGDPDFAAYYKEPSKKIDNPRLNPVYIYGESLERTYFDNDAFPNLTPELGALKTVASTSATPCSSRHGLHHRRDGGLPVRHSAVRSV